MNTKKQAKFCPHFCGDLCRIRGNILIGSGIFTEPDPILFATITILLLSSKNPSILFATYVTACFIHLWG